MNYLALAAALAAVRWSYPPPSDLFRACDDHARSLADAIVPAEFRETFLAACGWGLKEPRA